MKQQVSTERKKDYTYILLPFRERGMLKLNENKIKHVIKLVVIEMK